MVIFFQIHPECKKNHMSSEILLLVSKQTHRFLNNPLIIDLMWLYFVLKSRQYFRKDQKSGQFQNETERFVSIDFFLYAYG